MIRSPLAIAALIALVTALAFWLERRVAFLSKVSASLLVILFGALLSNTGVVPAASPVYDAISGPVTSLAIVWLLLSVRLSDLRRAGPRMSGAFALAGAGTALGAVVGALVFAGHFGDDTWRLAGTFTGTYTGGGLNFVAVGRAVELPDTLFAGATAADNVTTALWFAITLSVPLWLGRFFPPVPPAAVEGHAPPAGAGTSHHPYFVTRPVSTLSLSILLAIGAVLLVASELTATLVPAVPAVLWLTTFALIVAHLPGMERIEGSLQLGNLALHLFFAVIGIYSRVGEILAVGIEVFWYTIVVVVVHGLVLFGVGRLIGLDIGTLSVASQASVGGPSTALAQAVTREWPGLVLPGMAVGLLGYAVGNYLGLGVALLVRTLL
jgi:uncharacterized membrane protein